MRWTKLCQYLYFSTSKPVLFLVLVSHLCEEWHVGSTSIVQVLQVFFLFVQLSHDDTECPEYTEFTLKDTKEDTEDRMTRIHRDYMRGQPDAGRSRWVPV